MGSRHARDCSICSHKNRAEIETEFLHWESPARLARRFHVCRRSIYRHASALELFEKRARNIRAALEKVIERGCETPISARGLVSAVEAYAKINAAGKWIERRETINLNDLFQKMSEEELETYARDGKLPDWFERTVMPSTEAREQSK
jgi:hypothetical protein